MHRLVGRPDLARPVSVSERGNDMEQPAVILRCLVVIIHLDLRAEVGVDVFEKYRDQHGVAESAGRCDTAEVKRYARHLAYAQRDEIIERDDGAFDARRLFPKNLLLRKFSGVGEFPDIEAFDHVVKISFTHRDFARGRVPERQRKLFISLFKKCGYRKRRKFFLQLAAPGKKRTGNDRDEKNPHSPWEMSGHGSHTINDTITPEEYNQDSWNRFVAQASGRAVRKKSPAWPSFLEPSLRRRVGFHLNGSKSVNYIK
jgi:hypothetical protein